MRYQDLTREQVVEALTNELVSYLWDEDRDFDFVENDHAVLRSYLRRGFIGFETRSDKELAEVWRGVFGADDDEGDHP